MKELLLFPMFLFHFRFYVAEKAPVGRRDIFGVIVNLLPHLELLINAKTISFMVASTNVYGVFLSIVPPIMAHYPPPFFTIELWSCFIWLLDHLTF